MVEGITEGIAVGFIVGVKLHIKHTNNMINE